MTDTEILARLTIIMRSTFRNPDVVALPMMSADDVDGWDSLSHALFLLRVEKDFGVRLPASLAIEMQTLQDLVILLHNRHCKGEK